MSFNHHDCEMTEIQGLNHERQRTRIIFITQYPSKHVSDIIDKQVIIGVEWLKSLSYSF
jgi:hypothetical protein